MSDRYEYITVSSSDSKELYPDNSPSSFRVKLGWRVERKGTWQCALVRFSFTNTITTFNENQKIYIHEKGKDTGGEITVYADHYKSIEQLIKNINHHVKSQVGVSEKDRLPVIGLDRFGRVHKFEGVINGVPHVISFSQGLDLILGSNRNGFHHLDAFKNDIYVYTDIIKSTSVGDQSVPLLATIDAGSTDSLYGQQTVVKIKAPNYIPLSQTDISELEIQILDDTGKLINFGYGVVRLTLHFKEL